MSFFSLGIVAICRPLPKMLCCYQENHCLVSDSGMLTAGLTMKVLQTRGRGRIQFLTQLQEKERLYRAEYCGIRMMEEGNEFTEKFCQYRR